MTDHILLKIVILIYIRSLSYYLHRLETAWQTALQLDRKEIWLSLGGKALEQLNVDLGIRVYRQLKDAGMVMYLQSLVNIEDQPPSLLIFWFSGGSSSASLS